MKRRSPIGLRLDPKTHDRIKDLIPEKGTEHGTIVALIKLGIQAYSPEALATEIAQAPKGGRPKTKKGKVIVFPEFILPSNTTDDKTG